MTQAKGAQAYLSYVEESTWGTTPGSPSMKMLKAAVYGESLTASMEELTSNSINGNRSLEDMRGGNFDINGAIPFELSLLGFATILKHAIGSVDTTGSDPYTHVIKRDALPAGLTIEKGFSDIGKYFVYKGIKVNTIDFNVSNSGLVTGTLNVLGKSVADPSDTSLGTPSSVTHSPIVHHEAAVEEGGSSTNVLGLTCSIGNDHKADDYYVGSRNRGALDEGKGSATGTVTFLFEDETLYEKWLNETESSLKVTYTVTGGSIEFYWPRIKYTGEAAPKIETAQGIVLAMNYTAMYDDTEETDIKVTVINSEATI